MLPLAKMYSVLTFAENNQLFKQLAGVYDELPQTSCQMCGTCCANPRPASFMEYVNVYRYVRDNLADLHQEIVKKAIAFFFLELVDADIKCPFLGKDDRCLIYPVRPLSCRAFGILADGEHDIFVPNMAAVAEQYQKEYGITLPDEVVNFTLPACGDIKLEKGQKVNAEFLERQLLKCLALDSRFVPPDLAFEQRVTMMPLAKHLAATVLNEGIRAKRPDVMKEYLENGGSSLLLDKFVARGERFSF
ncbi:MAG: YkgJ family cysteine cluster protein [Peptococcaceae bacterium]|nr:YkgJ family cysteine cluster protein [Peptococcaceae bacterium]